MASPIGIARCLLVTPWTALVTASAVSMARLSGEAEWIPRGERVWAKGLLCAWQVRLDVDWPSGLDAAGPYVIMANHTSHLDVPVLFAGLPFVPGFVAKKELDHVPILSMALRAGGHVLLDRDDRSSARRALRAAATRIRQGQNLALFPEGTRGDGRTLLPFKRGGFLLAKTAGVPILPVGIRGSHRVLPRGRLVPSPERVTVRVGRPIGAGEVRGTRPEQLLERVRAQIGELCGVSAGRR
jgi:1-acyl-sn-glycerol-3-phosphate acyltransferase